MSSNVWFSYKYFRTKSCFLLVNTSQGIVDSWYWNFGDGYISTQPNPIHIYRQTGYFDVMLVVSNEDGSDSLIKENYIQVLAKPQADFTADVTVGSPPLGVQFADISIGNCRIACIINRCAADCLIGTFSGDHLRGWA